MDRRISVLGAGIVGVCCALELQRRGFEVTLIDRRGPGEETSFGNAGVISRSSLVPFNNPTLYRSLPGLLANQSASFRYNSLFLARHLAWAMRFLWSARPSACSRSTQALDALISLSIKEHQRLLSQAQATQHLRSNGWIFLFRQAAGFAAGARSRQVFERFNISTQALSGHELQELEPALKPIFAKALWIKDCCSVDDPGAVVRAYASLFSAGGGRIVSDSISAIQTEARGAWQLQGTCGTYVSKQVVVALGPWSKEFLAPLGMRVPLAFERGYHMHYQGDPGMGLQRPVYDTAGGYVASPMRSGLRLTTGVELNALDAAPASEAANCQLAMAERSAREAITLGARLDQKPWLGRRPSLPDSRPMIGPAPGRPGLWLAFGHQHIGFNTGPGTAALLGAQITNDKLPIDDKPFLPSRYLSA